MKNLIISLSLATLSLFAASCKKDSDIDPREQYLGSYNVTASSLTGSTNLPVPAVFSSDNGTLEVIKGDAENSISFTLADSKFSFVSLSGSYFYFSKSEKQKSNDGSEYFVNYDGTGAFSGKDVSMNMTLDYTTAKGAKVKSVFAIKGKKR